MVADVNYHESLSTLRFADQAKKCVTKPKKKVTKKETKVENLEAEIEKMKADILAGKELDMTNPAAMIAIMGMQKMNQAGGSGGGATHAGPQSEADLYMSALRERRKRFGLLMLRTLYLFPL